ncbi:MAG: hypothetical protein ACR2PT_18590 [Endozoicomonas sp.]
MPEIFRNDRAEPYSLQVAFPLLARLLRLIEEKKENSQTHIKQAPVTQAQPTEAQEAIAIYTEAPIPVQGATWLDRPVMSSQQSEAGTPLNAVTPVIIPPCSLCMNEICNANTNCHDYAKTEAYQNWIKFLNTFISRGAVIKVFTRHHGTPREKMDKWLAGGVSSASFVILGMNAMLFAAPYSRASRMALAFSPDVSIVARYKEDIASQTRIRVGLFESGQYDSFPKNMRHTEVESTYKCHVCEYSFIYKLREQCLREKEFLIRWRKEGGSLPEGVSEEEFFVRRTLTSGHLKPDGTFLCGKNKAVDSCRCRFNEVLVNWIPGKKEIQAIVIPDPLKYQQMADVSTLIKALQAAQYTMKEIAAIPVVYFDEGRGGFSYLGSSISALSLARKIENQDQKFLSLKAHTAGRSDSHNPYYDVLEALDPKLGDDCQLPFSSIQPLAGLLPETPCLFRHLLQSEAYADNIEKLLFGLPKEAKDLYNKQVYRSVLAASVFRQLLEYMGVSFTEEEALMLSYASVVYSYMPTIPWALDTFSKLMTEQGVNPELKLYLEQALLLPINDAIDVADLPLGVRLYYLILSHSGLHLSRQLPVELVLPYLSSQQVQTFYQTQAVIQEQIMGLAIDKILRWKRHFWPLLIQELQDKCREIVASALRSPPYSLDIQGWPYAEMSILLPENLSLLEMVMITAYPRVDSPVVESLVRHYVSTGLPLFLGTLRSSQITPRLLERVSAEMQKHPNTSLIPLLFNVKNRSWEQYWFPWDGLEPF